MKKITVIIPTYKPQDYLWRCLDSLVGQTLGKDQYEVILVLNGCKEPYDGEIKNYAVNHSQLPLEYIQTDKGGVSNARNIGIDAANGDYITFIDDDDYVSPRYLEALLDVGGAKSIGISNAVAVKNDVERPYVMGQVFAYNKQNNKHRLYDSRKFMSGPCMKVFHKDVIGDRRFNTGFTNGEDSLFMFQVSDRITRCEFTSADAIYYRCYRENSLFTRKRTFGERMRNSLRLIREYTRIYFSHPLRYNLRIYITRVAASLHSAISDN